MMTRREDEPRCRAGDGEVAAEDGRAVGEERCELNAGAGASIM